MHICRKLLSAVSLQSQSNEAIVYLQCIMSPGLKGLGLRFCHNILREKIQKTAVLSVELSEMLEDILCVIIYWKFIFQRLHAPGVL